MGTAGDAGMGQRVVIISPGCRGCRLLGQFLLHLSPCWLMVQWLHTGALLQVFLGLREVWFYSAFEALRLAGAWLALRPARRGQGESRWRCVPRREHRF